ncbi:MAG: Preprotein translocase, SecE subunit [Parcubacteria group bacterium GW2011_GWF2_38_76]|nr:MAG: Preprotein translocase, SecE subunit [Parcubacteria group bacterium GW2011_GWF2_38_76]HBM45851.1 preprotein translocase subunit SecE [Patescibacteria group bacterium]
MFDSFIAYVKETRAELRHVSWPTKAQTINFTVAVIIISILTSFYLAFFDGVFISILQKVILI